MSDAWYYAEGDKSVGPVTLKALKVILSRLTDARDVLIWHAGFAGWQKAATIRELSETFTQPPTIQSDGNYLPPIRPSLVIPVAERVKRTEPQRLAPRLLISACVLMICGWLLWPYYAVHRLSAALQNGDALALEDQVDWASVREGLRGDLNATLIRKLRTEPDNNSVGTGLASLLAPAIINQIVDSYVTPQTIAYLIRTGRPSLSNTLSDKKDVPKFSAEEVSRLLESQTTGPTDKSPKAPAVLASLKYDGKNPATLRYGDFILIIDKDSNALKAATHTLFSMGQVTHAFFFGGPFTFRLDVTPPQSQLKSPLTLLFKWTGDWKLTRIVLPVDAFDQSATDSTSDNSPQPASAIVQYKGRPAFSVHFDLDNAGMALDQAELRVMKLDPSSSAPQVLFTRFTGGAHCCIETKIGSMDQAGTWHLVDAGLLDGDGYEFQDLDGNGGLDLISIDNSFLYAFAPYAGSNAPTRIKKLNVTALDDVTAQPQYRGFLKARLREMEASARTLGSTAFHSNGFLGGWVAQKVLVGELADAWKIMLASYDRNSDWTTEVCTRPVPVKQCQDAERKQVAFPEALAAHLFTHKYITLEEEHGLALAAPQQPSANAVGAHTPKQASPSATLSQSELDALRARLSQCWTPPRGVDGPDLFVVLHVLFKSDGSLASEPAVVQSSTSALGPALADSAKRALVLCQPFTMLKPEHYDQWKDIEVKFDPHELLGH